MVDILLATYNGERFLREQIDSLLSQTYQNIRILIRDDGSTDGTISIVREYEKQHPDKVKFITDDKKGGSSAKNFFLLCSYATSEYAMFCDQDDFWLPNKVKVTLEKMRSEEEKIGADRPILVFSEYSVVDENLKLLPVKESHNQVAAYKLDLPNLLVQNYVTGCLAMVNRALYTKMGVYTEAIQMHDWWAALISVSLGTLLHLPEKTMLYRQHGGNVVGAVDVKSFAYRLERIKDPKTRKSKEVYRAQAQVFLERYGDILGEKENRVFSDFLHMYESRWKVVRVYRMIRGGFVKSDFVRILGQIWFA